MPNRSRAPNTRAGTPGSGRRSRSPVQTTALFVRVPVDHARRLERIASELALPKQEVVARMIADHPRAPPGATEAVAAETGLERDRRRFTVELDDGPGLTVGHHAFRPNELEVLTLDEAAELLRVEVALVERAADAGELPGRLLGGEWRFARRGLLAWLAAETPDSDPSRPGAPPAGAAGGER